MKSLKLEIMKRLTKQCTKGFNRSKSKFTFDSGLKGLGVVRKWDVELAVKIKK